ncbi:MAG: ATP-binding protein [Verrucomicrobiota bacterium]
MDKSPVKGSSGVFRTQIRLLILAAILVQFLVAIFIFARAVQEKEYQNLRDQLTIQGIGFIHELDDLNLSVIHDRELSRGELTGHPLYQESTNRLLEFSEVFSIDPSLLYTMVRSRDGEHDYYFILIGDGTYSLQKDDPFYLSEEVQPYFDLAYETGEIQYPPVYTDSIGKWLTVVLPMKDADGNVYAIHEPVLRVEFVDALVWEAVWNAIQWPLAILLIGLIAISALLNRVFRPFNDIVQLFRKSRAQDDIDMSSIKATGEFEELRKSLSFYIDASRSAKRETQEILQNVQQGLFLLSSDLTIGEIQSTQTRKIFETTKLTGIHFDALLKQFVVPKLHEAIVDFLDLMFSGTIDESTLRDLNPLKEVECHLPLDQGGFVTKHLSFEFYRAQSLANDSELEYVMVTVQDVSEEVRLAEELAQRKEAEQNQMELLMDILKVEPSALNDFFADAQEASDEINVRLRGTKNDDNLHTLVNDIFRLVHSVRGHASMLGLPNIEQASLEFEESLAELRERSELNPRDFLDITFHLEEVSRHLKQLEEITDRLSRFRPQTPQQDITQSLLDTFKSLVKDTAAQLDKEASLDTSDFKAIPLSDTQRRFFREIVIQLLRNAVSHGIELPGEREVSNKSSSGSIRLSSQEISPGQWEVIIRDDGRGIQRERLLEEAQERGLELSNQDRDSDNLLKLMSTPGLSTAENVDISGRGVGMDIINQRVIEMGGSLEVFSDEGHFTEFRITLNQELSLSS